MKIAGNLLVATVLAAGANAVFAQEAWDYRTHRLELRNATTDLYVVTVSVSGGLETGGRSIENEAMDGNWLHEDLSPGQRRSFDVRCLRDVLSALEHEEYISWNVHWRDAEGKPVFSSTSYEDPCFSYGTVELTADDGF